MLLSTSTIPTLTLLENRVTDLLVIDPVLCTACEYLNGSKYEKVAKIFRVEKNIKPPVVDVKNS